MKKNNRQPKEQESEDLEDIDALRLLIAGFIQSRLSIDAFNTPEVSAKTAWDHTDALFTEFQNRKRKKS
jgi:hypothetical protein